MQEKETKGKSGFIKGAAWIAFGGFAAKLIGALYRIPLTNLIGGQGIGLYQLVYPVYCLLLTVSATGIPASIAKLTAERIGRGVSDRAVFKTAMGLFLVIGGVGTLLMALLALPIAKAQGSDEVLFGYYALAPSVFLVSGISVFRGYFQGRNRMAPTAVSEIVEQLVKVAFGLLFAYLYRDNVPKAVTLMLLAVSLSEGAALLMMACIYKKSKKGKKSKEKVLKREILALSVPVTFSAMLLPLSALIDSVLAPRLLGVYAAAPVSLFGLFSGGAITIINLPVSICYGIAAASVPAIASLPIGKERRKRIIFSLFITAAVALPSALGLYLFASPVANIIFRSLQKEELSTLIRLVKTLSVSALTLSCAQTLSACLTAQGKPKLAALSMLIAVTIKTAVYVLLLQKPEISVFGLAHATNLCYLVAFLLNLLYNLRVSKRQNNKQETEKQE